MKEDEEYLIKHKLISDSMQYGTCREIEFVSAERNMNFQ
jgi:hypothetical protein